MTSKRATDVPDPAIVEYFSAKLREHGATSRGVDWNGDAAQLLRFRQMVRVIPAGQTVTVADLGCGYGAFLDYLDAAGIRCRYRGIDASSEMVAAARSRFAGRPDAEFVEASGCTDTCDYTIANGIFNVRLDVDDARWLDYIVASLDDINAHTKRAFAFNCLTRYSDRELMRGYLYYADPCALFDYCKQHYAKDVALWHDYGAYEFTIVVRKIVD